jgi:EAL domain-containing protein (putative c-di-GMP-specific phosphodiesterase class I)
MPFLILPLFLALIGVEWLVRSPTARRWSPGAIVSALLAATAGPAGAALAVAVPMGFACHRRSGVAIPHIMTSATAALVATGSPAPVPNDQAVLAGVAVAAAVAVLSGSVRVRGGCDAVVVLAGPFVGYVTAASISGASGIGKLSATAIVGAVVATVAETERRGAANSRHPATGLVLQAAAVRRAASTIPAAATVHLGRMIEVTAILSPGLVGDLLAEIGSRTGPHGALHGSDETLVLLPEDGEGHLDVQRRAMRVAERLREPFRLGDLSVTLVPAVGIVIGGSEPSQMVRRSNEAAARAKTTPGLMWVDRGERNGEAVDDLRLIADLTDALDRRGIDVAYQPIVGPHGKTVAVEALARWEHPTRGSIPPGRFIELARLSGNILALTKQVFDTTLSDLERWHAQGHDLWAQINIDASLLHDPGCFEFVAGRIERAAVPPSAIVLEVTEAEALAPDSERILFELRELGLRISMDDFGAGYSSLARIRKMPIDQLKADKSFIGDVAHDEQSQIVLIATLRIAGALGIQSVCEGVETNAQADLLREFGVDLQQGYLHGRPVPADMITERLAVLDDAEAAQSAPTSTMVTGSGSGAGPVLQGRVSPADPMSHPRVPLGTDR